MNDVMVDLLPALILQNALTVAFSLYFLFSSGHDTYGIPD